MAAKVGLVATVVVSPGLVARADEAAERLALAVEALTRIEGLDLQSNPAMKQRVLQVLDRTRGTPNFVRLVRHFALRDQEAGLVEVAIARPREESGVDAVRCLLGNGQTNLLATRLAQGGTPAQALAEALGNSGQRDAVKVLLPALNSTGNNPATGTDARPQIVRALARSADGARELLALVEAGSIKEPLRALAIDELAQTRWETIRIKATELRGQTNVKWPSVAELLRSSGDVGRGRAVFFRPNPGCANCHVVQGQGTELGPNLSEIGGKLGREALLQAVLEPSAGISFGYEAYTVTLKDGDEVYGLIASETATELAIKTVGGAVTRHRKSEIVSREKARLSMMPAGLEAGLTPQELVDLVEFLAALKR